MSRTASKDGMTTNQSNNGMVERDGRHTQIHTHTQIDRRCKKTFKVKNEIEKEQNQFN